MDTVLQRIGAHVLERPSSPAFTWLDGDQATTWTWGKLTERAAGVAAVVARHAAPGTPVLLVTPEGDDGVLGLLGTLAAGVVPVPLHAPDGPRADEAARKLAAVARSVRPAAVVTTTGVAPAVVEAVGPGLPVVHVDRCAEAAWRPAAATIEQVAWLQFTSGSTGAAKGVEVCHGALARNLAAFVEGTAVGADSVVLTWLPGAHDLGLVFGLCVPWWCGAHAVRLAPEAFVREPGRWLRALSAWRATHTASPDFGLALAAARTPASALDGVDLSALRVVLNGAEPVRVASERAFVERFGPVGLDPGALVHAYGMSEAVAVMSTERPGAGGRFRGVDPEALGAGRMVDASGPGTRWIAGNGLAVRGLEIGAFDPETGVRCAADTVGELWVRGETIGRGYHGSPEASEVTFRARDATGDGPWLRTGDLGALDASGVVYVTGRAKDVIVLRGVNHHAEDVEATAEATHPAVRPGGVVAIPVDGGEEEALVVVAEVREGAAAAAVAAAVRDGVASVHGVVPGRVVIVPARTIPKTSSGKRRRRETASRLAAGALPILHDARADRPRGAVDPATASDVDVGTFLRGVVAGRLGVPASSVPGTAALRDLGLDSLDLVDVAAALSARLGREVPTTALFDHPSVDALARAFAPVSEDDALLDAIAAELAALDGGTGDP